MVREIQLNRMWDSSLPQAMKNSNPISWIYWIFIFKPLFSYTKVWGLSAGPRDRRSRASLLWWCSRKGPVKDPIVGQDICPVFYSFWYCLVQISFWFKLRKFFNLHGSPYANLSYLWSNVHILTYVGNRNWI